MDAFCISIDRLVLPARWLVACTDLIRMEQCDELWRSYASHPSQQRSNRTASPPRRQVLTGAAAIKRLDLTGYILGAALPQAGADIAEAEVTLSERDSLHVLALLQNPPAAPITRA
jgi:uncharacterized protein (DUF1778 family)